MVRVCACAHFHLHLIPFQDRLNVHGGAVALGHPLGMSGNRVAITALYEIGRRGGGTAAVALCGGGGQGDAAILRTI